MRYTDIDMDEYAYLLDKAMRAYMRCIGNDDSHITYVHGDFTLEYDTYPTEPGYIYVTVIYRHSGKGFISPDIAAYTSICEWTMNTIADVLEDEREYESNEIAHGDKIAEMRALVYGYGW